MSIRKVLMMAGVLALAGLSTFLLVPKAFAQAGVYKPPYCVNNPPADPTNNAAYWNATFGRCMNTGFFNGENTKPDANLDTVPLDSHGGIDTRYQYHGLDGAGFWVTDWWWVPTVCTNQPQIETSIIFTVIPKDSDCTRNDDAYTETFINTIKANISANYACEFPLTQNPDANSCAGIRRHAVNSALVMATMMGKKGTSFQDPARNATQSMVNAISWARDPTNFNSWATLVRSYNAAGLVNWDQPHQEPVNHINSTEINYGTDYVFFSWDQAPYTDAIIAFKDKNGNIIWSMNRACGNIVGKSSGLPTLNYDYEPTLKVDAPFAPTSTYPYLEGNTDGTGGYTDAAHTSPMVSLSNGTVSPGDVLNFTIRTDNKGAFPGPAAGMQGKVTYVPVGRALQNYWYWQNNWNQAPTFPEMGYVHIQYLYNLEGVKTPGVAAADVPPLDTPTVDPLHSFVSYTRFDQAKFGQPTFAKFGYGASGFQDASPAYMKFTIPAGAQPGDNFCFWAHVGPGSPTDGIHNSDYQCYQVKANLRLPSVQASNGDVHAGGGVCGQSSGTGNISGFTGAGSGGQYVVSASAAGGISNFYSGDTAGSSNLNLGKNGGYAQVCRPDLLQAARDYTGATAITDAQAASFDVSGKTGVYIYSGANLNIHGTVDQKLTVVNLTGTITVTANVTLSTASQSRATTPSLGVIAEGNILINPSATQVDAYMFSDSVINTCNGSGLACNNVLTINGFVMAQKLSLGRLGPAGSTGAQVAEQITLNPQIYLNPPKLFDSSVDAGLLEGQGERAPLF